MSLIARKAKLLMQSRGASPFSASGSFENSADGWTFSDISYVAQFPRTGSYSARAGAGGYAEITYTAGAAFGLDFAVSIYHRANGSSVTRSLKYKIGSGSFVTLQTVTNSSSSYAQFSGSFSNPGDDSVTLRFEASGPVWFDDWSVNAT